MKIRALGLLILLALALAAPAWSLGQPSCADDCSPESGRPCSYACGCCPCCQLPAAMAALPEIRPEVSTVSVYVQPPAALPAPEPRGLFHVPRSA
jgi:hypothetical protein